MTDNTPETQALFPVTQADRDAAADLCEASGYGQGWVIAIRDGLHDNMRSVQAFARHRLSHSRALKAARDGLQRIRDRRHQIDASTLWCDMVDDMDAFACEALERSSAALTSSALSGDNSQSSSNAGGVDVEALRKALYPFSRAWKYWSELKRLKPDAEGVDEGPKGFVIWSEFKAAHEALASLSTPTAEPTPTPDRIGKDAVREAVNRILGELLGALMPNVQERIAVGNRACDEILAALQHKGEVSRG